MQQILIDKGFSFIGRCGLCPGSPAKYQRGSLVVYYKKGQFRIRKGNAYITNWESKDKANEVLEKVVSEEAQSIKGGQVRVGAGL